MVFVGLVSTKLVLLDPLTQYFTVTPLLIEAMEGVGMVVGGLLLVLGSFLFYNWISNLFRYGRIFNTKMNTYFRENFLKIILLLLSLLYIPITNSLFSSLNCEWKRCEAGTEFPVSDISFNLQSIQKSFSRLNAVENATCSRCGFDALTCPIADMLCPETSDLRLVRDFLSPHEQLIDMLSCRYPTLTFRAMMKCTRFICQDPCCCFLA